MVSSAPEVTEAEAQGPTKAMYEDIKNSLRVPFVPALFRSLAVYPYYLTLAWNSLKPNALTVYFERSADDVRRYASEATSSASRPPAAEGEVGNALRVLNYADPKVLLAASALRVATTGQMPRMTVLPRGDKQQIVPGIPEGAADIGGGPLPGGLEELRSTLGWDIVPDEFHVLGRSVPYLTAVTPAVTALTQDAAFRRTQIVLRRMTNDAVAALPYRMDIGPHVLRQSGLSESNIDGIRAVLDGYDRAMPGVTLLVGYLATGTFGSDAALSPYPAAVL